MDLPGVVENEQGDQGLLLPEPAHSAAPDVDSIGARKVAKVERSSRNGIHTRGGVGFTPAVVVFARRKQQILAMRVPADRVIAPQCKQRTGQSGVIRLGEEEDFVCLAGDDDRLGPLGIALSR